MPFYIRDSVKVGPFRFNLSKSGVGASFGVTGFRIGTVPRGHYIHAGRNGLYYRASLNGKKPAKPRPNAISEIPESRHTEPLLQEIESESIESFQDSRFQAYLDDLETAAARISRVKLIVFPLIITAVFLFYKESSYAILVLLLAIPGFLIGRRLNASQCKTVAMYSFDDSISRIYEVLTEKFDELSETNKSWHIEAEGNLHDGHIRKLNSGASGLVSRKTIKLGYQLPAALASNITPPFIPAGRQTLYFLPDVILIFEGKKAGAISYTDLDVEYYPGRFIEDEKVPTDATVVGQTWRYPNKNGGPDRRFASNYQIPICLYGYLSLTSSSGLNELFHFSQPGVCRDFSICLKYMKKYHESSD